MLDGSSLPHYVCRFSIADLTDTGLIGAFDTVVDVPNLRLGTEVLTVLKVQYNSTCDHFCMER